VIKHNAAESYSVDSSMAISKNWNKKCYVKENWHVDYMNGHFQELEQEMLYKGKLAC